MKKKRISSEAMFQEIQENPIEINHIRTDAKRKPCQRQRVEIKKRRATSPFPTTSNFQNLGAKLVGSCCAVRRNYCHCDPSLTSFGRIK